MITTLKLNNEGVTGNTIILGFAHSSRPARSFGKSGTLCPSLGMQSFMMIRRVGKAGTHNKKHSDMCNINISRFAALPMKTRVSLVLYIFT